MTIGPLVAESGRTALGLARGLSSDDLAQVVAAVDLVATMPRGDLEYVAEALALLLAGLVLTSGLGWDTMNDEMEKRIAR